MNFPKLLARDSRAMAFLISSLIAGVATGMMIGSVLAGSTSHPTINGKHWSGSSVTYQDST